MALINRKKPMQKRRRCDLCENKIHYVDYKNTEYLTRFIASAGQIKPRANTGTCAKDQRKIALAIKRARFMALMPYTKDRVRVIVAPTAKSQSN
ncbi:30S ribosomal protein S18 [Mycoplasmopsis opalescens]|uniref:30S ribosomal protein S18 n=1 Tax=Mycoplasmopsis opalescens TaxID=114886 RepID=UPI0004A782F6|nr:30S ribosomal protein S18 [Mycoplasmopsis opalescens]